VSKSVRSSTFPSIWSERSEETEMTEATAALEAVFREESGRIIATLIRICGSFDLAEEAMQEAFASALATWPLGGIPRVPAAWITAAAQRKLIDRSRRERTKHAKQDSLRYEIETSQMRDDSQFFEETPHFPDDRLRLIFTCCHPALNQEARVALTLRTLGGLSTPEIAKAFLLPEATLAQRLVRAKRKIQEARIPYEVPTPERLPERLASVQAVVYLIFNEGYAASAGDQLVRRDLCAEAIRLGRLLCQLSQDLSESKSENMGLLALMLLHDSRRNARVRDAELVPLEEQDRSLWDASEIAEGLALLESGLREGPLGPYQLQAAIAALHAQARQPAETDWPQIAQLYQRLLTFNSSAVIALNHAVAIAMSEGLDEGLKRIEALGSTGQLEGYYLFHAARAEVLNRMRNRQPALEAYRRALELATNPVERRFLERKIRLAADPSA
jgi:RNA polymerase sigma-70 factor (ECF subfamily)